MSQLSILTALVRGGMTPIAACAMGGNMMCESNMTANIAQRGMTTLTDAEYTAAYEQAQSESAAEIADMQSALNVMGVSVNE